MLKFFHMYHSFIIRDVRGNATELWNDASQLIDSANSTFSEAFCHCNEISLPGSRQPHSHYLDIILSINISCTSPKCCANYMPCDFCSSIMEFFSPLPSVGGSVVPPSPGSTVSLVLEPLSYVENLDHSRCLLSMLAWQRLISYIFPIKQCTETQFSSCRDTFSDADSLIGPDDTTVAYGESNIDTEAASYPWNKFVPSLQPDSVLSSSQVSDPDCVYCKHKCE